MAGTIVTNSVQPDVGTNLYLDATQGNGKVIIGNTTTTLMSFDGTGKASSVSANNGLYSSNNFTGTYTGGVVVDYTSGRGRISVGSGDALTIYNGGVASSALMTLDSSGNMGLGVTPLSSGTTAFEVKGGGDISFQGNGNISGNAYYSGGAYKYATSSTAVRYNMNGASAGGHAWYTAPSGTAGAAISFTQAMTLDASGNLALGATSVTANHRFTLKAPTANYCQVSLIGGDTANYLTLGTLNDSNTFFISQNGTERVRIDTSGWAKFMQNTAVGYLGSGSSLTAGGSASDFMIRSEAVLSFATNGANERARIGTSGNFLVGLTSLSSNYSKIQTVSDGTNIGGVSITQTGTGQPALEFYNSSNQRKGVMYQDVTTPRLYVVCNESNGVYLASAGTSWTSASDERLKTDLKPIENAAQKVSTLRAVTGRYITDEENVSRSFLIAQDVHAVLPEAVDASDPDKLGVQYTDTIPLLVAAIKELSAELNELKSKVNA